MNKRIIYWISGIVLLISFGIAGYFALLNFFANKNKPLISTLSSVPSPVPVAQAFVIADPTAKTLSVTLTDKDYLQRKLAEFGFWSEDAVSVFSSTQELAPTKVTASQVYFSVTNTPSQEAFDLDNGVKFTPYYNGSNGSLAVHLVITDPTDQKLSNAIISAAYYLPIQ